MLILSLRDADYTAQKVKRRLTMSITGTEYPTANDLRAAMERGRQERSDAFFALFNWIGDLFHRSQPQVTACPA